MTPSRIIPVVLLCGLTACSAGDIIDVPATAATDQFWSVRTDTKPLTVAKDETFQLTARSYDANGVEIPNLPRPVFRSADPTRVYVDSNGLVTGRTVTASINVIASLTVNGVTRADTTPVAVTANRYAIRSLKILSPTGDTVASRVSINTTVPISVRITDSSGAPVLGNAIMVSALDPRIFVTGTSAFGGRALGKTKIIAVANSYGRQFADTIEVGVIYLMATTISFGPGIVSPDAVVIGVGGSVQWNNNSYLQTPANITFDEPEKVTGGNIPLLNFMQAATRSFPTAGIYRYTNTLSGAKGAIYVREQPTY